MSGKNNDPVADADPSKADQVTVDPRALALAQEALDVVDEDEREIQQLTDENTALKEENTTLKKKVVALAEQVEGLVQIIQSKAEAIRAARKKRSGNSDKDKK